MSSYTKYHQKYKEDHREKINEDARKWREKNKDRINAARRKRRAEKKAAQK